MAKGDTFAPEKTEYTDPETGHAVWQLTASQGHDHHLYFTETSFHPDGKRIVFASDRGGKFDHYVMVLETGEIAQLTDVTERLRSNSSVIDPHGEWLYFWEGSGLKAIHFDTYEERQLYTAPQGQRGGLISISSDGVQLAFPLMPIIELKSQTPKIYSGMAEMFERCTSGDIGMVKTDGSEHWIAYHENCWTSHVNICPADRDLILYCHEGSWADVAQRMWLVRSDGTDRRPLRLQEPEDALGHEYWLDDGVTVGYHGRRGPRKEGIFGLINKDGTNCREYVLPAPSNHCQSTHDGNRHVTDGLGGERYIYEIHPQDDGTAECTKVVKHEGTFEMQIGHPHPVISPDDKWVLYTSDRGGRCNVYLAEL